MKCPYVGTVSGLLRLAQAFAQGKRVTAMGAWAAVANQAPGVTGAHYYLTKAAGNKPALSVPATKVLFDKAIALAEAAGE